MQRLPTLTIDLAFFDQSDRTVPPKPSTAQERQSAATAQTPITGCGPVQRLQTKQSIATGIVSNASSLSALAPRALSAPFVMVMISWGLPKCNTRRESKRPESKWFQVFWWR